MYSVAILSIFMVAFGYGKESHFGYNSQDGPAHWFELDPAWSLCNPGRPGSLQSPINIITKDVVSKLNLQVDLGVLNGFAPGVLLNNGHAPTFTFDDKSKELLGVPHAESDTFLLEQFHFHFAGTDASGSEHKVDGKSYSGEIHLVFYNSKYGKFADAANKDDGLAVVGMFLKVASGRPNPAVTEFMTHMSMVTDQGSTVAFSVDPYHMLPRRDKFYTYKGSLTTPGCYESVRWIVMRQPLGITETSLNQLRSLHADARHLISEYGNDRPTQPLHGRLVESNF